MFQPDEWQQKSLLTWYSVDNPLHLDPRHPCIKLAGEAGEILDLYGKHEYKPGFDWWKCKYCGEDKKWHSELSYNYCHPFMGQSTYQYTPLILDELGDWWYYLRIISYIAQVPIKRIEGQSYPYYDILQILVLMAQNSCVVLDDYLRTKKLDLSRLQVLYGCLTSLLGKLGCSIEQLTELNYKKLNSEETNHGWKSATVKNRS